MAYVNNKKVTLGTSYNYNEAIKEIASLVNTGARADGKIYLADVCTSDGVNIWTKYKPININKESNITDSERDLHDYGLRQGSDYFYYWVKPTTWKRIRDFDGYNGNAIPPIQNSEHLSGKKSFIGGSVITLDPTKIVATGSNVEIPLNRLGFNFEQGYVGFAFINRANKKGWVHSVDYTLQTLLYDIEHGTSSTYSQQFGFDRAPDVSDGDIIDVYYCLTPTPNWQYATYVENSGIQIMCCDEKHGHAVITAMKITLSNITIATPTIYKSYSGNNATFTGCYFTLRCDFPFSEITSDGTAGDNMTFELYINNQLCGSSQLFINSASESVTIQNGSVVVDSDTLRDDNYLVNVSVRGKFTSQSTWKTFFNKSYNVQTSSYV